MNNTISTELVIKKETLSDKVQTITNLYKEIEKELVDIIKDKNINLVTEYPNGESDFITYFLGAEQYNVKSVCVSYYPNDKDNKFLCLLVDLVTTDMDGNVVFYEDSHELKEIPYQTAILLLNHIYKMLKQ